MGYSPTGPFTDNANPPLAAVLFNNVENFLLTLNSAATDSNISADGSGKETCKTIALTAGSLTRIAIAGPYTVTSTATYFNHNLGDVPDIVLAINSLVTNVVCSITYERSSMSSSQVKMQSNTSLGGVMILSIKL